MNKTDIDSPIVGRLSYTNIYIIKVVCELSQVLWYILVPSCPLFLWKCHILHNLYKVYILHNLHIWIFCLGISYLRSYEMLSHLEMVNIFTNAYSQPDHIFLRLRNIISVHDVMRNKSLLYSVFYEDGHWSRINKIPLTFFYLYVF